MFACKTKFMKIFNSGKTVINFEDYGSHNKEVLCFSNSLGTDNRLWYKIIDNFKDDYRIITYDKRGHGISNKPNKNLSIEVLANDIYDLLNHLKIKKVNFVGISIGGMIAQKLASKNPNLINKLVLCDTAVKIGNPAIWRERINLLKKNGLDGISDSIIARWFSKSFIEKNPDEIQIYKNMLNTTSVEGYLGCCEAIKNADLTISTNLIKNPTLVLVGENDLSTPPALVEDTAKLINNSIFKIIKNSGHLPCLDNPDEFSYLLKNFLK